eukprot:CFRG3603T1
MRFPLNVLGQLCELLGITWACNQPSTTTYTAESLVSQLHLTRHPEGGYYKEIYRSELSIPSIALESEGFRGERQCSTAIYFLLEPEQRSNFHRIKSDELWHHYSGCPTHIYYIAESKAAVDNGTVVAGETRRKVKRGKIVELKLGTDVANGYEPVRVVPAGVWFAAEVGADCKTYSFMGNTVSPGFDFADWEVASKAQLVEALGGGDLCDEYMTIIDRMTVADEDYKHKLIK